MAELPDDVVMVKQVLSRDPSDQLSKVAGKLIADTPDLVAMWKAFERRNVGHDDLWVWAFLQQAADASNLPPYHYKSAQERRDLADNIADLATRLARALTINELDAHLIHNNGKLFNGFHLYEDFGASNQARIDAVGTHKLKASELIEGIAERARQKIEDEPMPGKGGTNAQAIRFIRLIAARNIRLYEEPLNAVTATATNAIFGTDYNESDISNLLNR